MKTEEEVRAIKRRHSGRLLRQPGVSGVGVERDETGRYVLAIHFNTEDPVALQQLPNEIEGCPVMFVPSGPFRKFSS